MKKQKGDVMRKNRTKVAAWTLVLLISSFSYSQGQKLDPYQFFPANIGDRWEYTYAGPDQFYTVARDSIDTKDSSRIIFYDVWTTYNPRQSQYPLYRIDKKYNVFNEPQFDNLHEYKLDAQVGGKWVVFVSDSNKWEESRVSGIYESFVFGKLTTIKEIQHYQCWRRPDSLIDTTLIDVQKLAYGFGLISKENYVLQPYLLRGCRINGVTYGTVDVEEEPIMIPAEYVLYQNYPNPFNPTTNIKFSIPRYSYVRLIIYNALGREVETLVSNELAAGIHNIEWTAKNMASGIYFYRIEAENFVKVNKMLLLK